MLKFLRILKNIVKVAVTVLVLYIEYSLFQGIHHFMDGFFFILAIPLFILFVYVFAIVFAYLWDIDLLPGDPSVKYRNADSYRRARLEQGMEQQRELREIKRELEKLRK